MADAERLFQVVKYVHQHLAAGEFFGPKWLAGGDTSRNQLTQVETFRLLPVLCYCLTRQADPPPPAEMLHRVARYFYNISRSKSTIAGQPGTYLLAAIRLADALTLAAEDIAELPDLPGIALHHDRVLFSSEERWKLRQYRQPPVGLNREELETQLRELEDDEPNRGQVAHLFPEIDWHAPAPLTSERLLEVRTTYRQLFPEANELRAAQQRRLQSVLLDYAKYWQEISPYYYTNCAFDEWYDTVRQAAFKQFFSDFLQAGVSLETFSWQRQQAYFKGRTLAGLRDVRSIREQLFILAAAFEELSTTGQSAFSMWQCGHRIGFKSTAETQNDYPFFAHDVCYVNAHRYPYKDREGNYMTIVDELAKHSGIVPEQGVEWLLTKILAKVNP